MFRLTWILLALPVSFHAGALASVIGFEAGGNYSSYDLVSDDPVSPTSPNEETDTQVLPVIGVFAVRPIGASWSLGPSLRYVQSGMTLTRDYSTAYSSWSLTETMREHSLSGGLEIRYNLPHSLFVAMSPHVSYLLDATVTQELREPNLPPAHQESGYASNSDRWNAVLRAGAGAGWDVGGGRASLTLRYARSLNSMTRVAPTLLPQNSRNIAWFATYPPDVVTEWEQEGVELAAGFSW